MKTLLYSTFEISLVSLSGNKEEFSNSFNCLYISLILLLFKFLSFVSMEDSGVPNFLFDSFWFNFSQLSIDSVSNLQFSILSLIFVYNEENNLKKLYGKLLSSESI